jgi:hypothetical protein
MTLGETLIDSMWQSLPDARATATYGGATIAQAVCSGVDESWQETEQGVAVANASAVRYALTGEPTEWGGKAIIGKVIDLTVGGESYRARVTGRAVVAGAVRLTVIAEFERR